MKKLLLLTSFGIFGLASQAQDCAELFFSEYVEGSHNNKALEIYNPTNAAINLSAYRVVRWSNGSNTSDIDIRYTQPLTGTIQPLSTYIIALDKQSPTGTGNDTALFGALLTVAQAAEANGSGGFYSPNYDSGDMGSRTIYHNGDDALSLQKTSGTTWANVDIFGVIGEQPIPATGTSTAGWTDEAPYWDGQGAYWTKDKTLIRKASVKKGVNANPGAPYTGAFNPTVEYDSLPENTFSNLGSHDCICAQLGTSDMDTELGLSIYPNPTDNEVVTIASKLELNRISVINVLGQEIFGREAISTRNMTIETAGFEAGVYLIQLEFDGGLIATRRLVVR